MPRAMVGTSLAGAACLALTAGLTALAPGAGAAGGRSVLSGARPSWASSSALRGAAPASDTVHLRVYLNYRDPAGLAATAAAVSTPGSAAYGHYLTPAQFRQKYAPSASDAAGVANFLRKAGFSVANTPDNNRYVAVEGTVAQANAAFATRVGLYSAYGTTLRAPETDPSVPAEVAGLVSGVVGLDDSPKLQAPSGNTGTAPGQNHGAPGIGFRAGTPCSTYYGEKKVTTSFAAYGSQTKPLAVCGYTPAQVRGLYQLGANDTGQDQTVAFVGANASPTLVGDVTQFSRLHNLPDPNIRQLVAPGVYRHPDTPKQVPGDYYGEETLDAEAIHTTAPAAHLLYVASSNANQDFDAAINHIVDKHLAPIISISYGFTGEGVPRGFINSLNGTFQQAVVTGIGVFVSSGDGGDEVGSLGTPSVDFYADSPYVTAVGGTSAAVVPVGTPPHSARPTGASADSASALYGLDKPANPVNQPGWKRDFEVGWQTGLDKINSPLLAPTDLLATTFSLSGTLASDLPGTFNGGGGGGVSRLFPQPSYQKGVTDRISTSGRAVPDISALADPNTGFLVGQTQSCPNGTYFDEHRIGGTSLSAPLMAGMAAVANQKAGRPLGFLNPRIYAAYRTSATTAYYDVNQQDRFCSASPPPSCTATDPLPAEIRVNFFDNQTAASGRTYSLRTLESPAQTLHSTRGYDTATGVGTPNGDEFLAAIGN